MGPEAALWTARAWVDGSWQDGVLLMIDRGGHWAEICTGIARCPAGAQALSGPALPGLVDAHSHAFQRAFAGLAERRDEARDDFWSWRERMHGVAARITPALLAAIAAQLFVELLRGGYTQVVEFHYLQHAADGSPYDDPLALAWALADAANAAGIGLTIVPAVYERAGFDDVPLRAPQQRFRLDADAAWNACRRLRAAARPLLHVGLALHSLRAVTPPSIARLRALAAGDNGPIHIHVAEQTAEVEASLAASGARPIEWLAREGLLDARWQLVHATHATPAEIDAVAAQGAGIVLCPGTEANLGDGMPDLPHWLAAGVPIAIGSDSQVSRGWREELRLAEYAQRLLRRTRNVAARPGVQPATAARLFECALAAGSAAAGQPLGGLVAGQRADLLVVDTRDASVRAIPPTHLLDALVFSSPGRPWRDVMVAGRWVVRDHRHRGAGAIADRFGAAMDKLWQHQAP
ncbi:MAG: formimidoylglutamate deiminase [Gammaproteobacteria bacterium]|nr:MAG: formimidoylglutamate deiminase [Gammaproteobacteria bacterium]